MGLFKTIINIRENITFLENLKGYIDNEDRTVVNGDYLEEIISIPEFISSVNDTKYSNVFKIGCHQWEYKIYLSGDDIYLELKYLNNNEDSYINTYKHASTKVVLYVKNVKKYNKYISLESPFLIFDNFHTVEKFNIIKLSDLNNNFKHLLYNNNCIIGAYIRLYKIEDRVFKEIFMKDIGIKNKEKNNNNNEIKDDLFELTVNKLDILKKTINSQKFEINNQECVLMINPVHIDKTSFQLNINIQIDKLNLEEYIKCKNIYIYIRKCSDYSLYYCGEYNAENGITFKINYTPDNSYCMFENNKIVVGVYQQYLLNYECKFMEKIKNSVKDEPHIFESDGFFEWRIEDWNKLSKMETSSEFTIGNHKWKLELYPFGHDKSNKDFVSVRLKNTEAISDYYTHICIKNAVYIRHYNDYTCYHFKDDETFSYFSRSKNKNTLVTLLEHPDLYIERGQNNKPIIENNKCIIGIYVRIYKYDNEQYKEELINSINNENQLIQGNGFYEWKIDNWNEIYYEISSPEFKIDNYKWKLLLFPYGEKEDNQDFVTVKLQYLDEKNTNEVIYAKIIFFMKGINNSCFTMKGFSTFVNFKNNKDWVSVNLIKKKYLVSKNKNKSFIENNQCIIGVYIRTYKNGNDINNNINYQNKSATITEKKKNNEIKLVESKVEDDEIIDKQFEKIKRYSKTLEQLEKYEKILYKMKIYKQIIQEKEECEKKLEKMEVYVKELEDKINNGYYKKEDIKTPTLVISINKFSAFEYDQLDIRENEFLVVTDWNYEEGWAFGHRINNEEEMGIFPKKFVKIYKENEKEIITHDNQVTPEYRIKFDKKIRKVRALNGMKINSGETNVYIKRDNLFYDALYLIPKLTYDDMRKNLRVNYIGETGIDAGGLLRDFFYQLSKEIGNPNYALFQYSPGNSYELEINPKSSMANSHDLEYFKFVGRVMGLAIFNRHYLPLSFTLLFYKKLLGKAPEFSDLKNIDPEIYKNLNWLKEKKEVESLYLTFEIEEDDCFGNHKKVSLKPNGANIDVTDENKNEYIDLVVKHKLNNTGDENQFKALKEGFYEIIPKEINTIINEIDLKYLLSGIKEIDVEDWERNTVYEGYTKNDITIINFWKCVKELNNEKRTKLLLFATGNSQIPITGFKDLQGSGTIQPFKLKKTGNKKDLPISHTCFNRIDLPPYTSYTQLKQKLLRAITEGITGFQRE